jgi:hypothetical protein
MPSYHDVVQTFAAKKCRVLTTADEYAEILTEAKQKGQSSNFKIRYIASCGHEHCVFHNVFKHRNTGIICPDCKCKSNGEKAAAKVNTTEDGQDWSHLMLDESIDFLKDELDGIFDFKKTYEGCLAHFVLRPVGQTTYDSWMKVHVSTTSTTDVGYSFHLTNKCIECVIILHSPKDNKIWLLNGNDINTVKVSIGKSKSKYSEFEVSGKEGMVARLTEFYNILPKFPFEVCDIPIGYFGMREHAFRLFRESQIDFLDFEQNARNNVVFDFKINGKRVQEKVGSETDGENQIAFKISKRKGHGFQPYVQGDNDFYWLNFPDKITFFVIPEAELILHGIIKTETNSIKGGKYISLNPTYAGSKHSWANAYKFSYVDLDIVKLTEMFSYS